MTGKGRHLLYAIPPETQIGNSTRWLGSPAGVDIRGGRRGYVVAAPSRHASGTRYAWVDPGAPIHPLPAGYVEALVDVPGGREGTWRTLPATSTSSYGRAAMRSELQRLLQAREGERNKSLNRSVFRLAQLSAGGELDVDELEREALRFALLLSLEKEESENTIASAIKAGLGQPRGVSLARARTRALKKTL
jgi:hypothetical protein